MPTYEYECESCGRRFEERQRLSESLFSTCPECQGAVARVWRRFTWARGDDGDIERVPETPARFGGAEAERGRWSQ